MKIEPKIGEIISVNGIKCITQKASDVDCSKCALCNSYCWNIVCNAGNREDRTPVMFKKVKTDMNEVKIQIPDNCEFIKDGDTYIVRKKQEPPRSWEEFCENYPRTEAEYFITTHSIIKQFDIISPRDAIRDKNLCSSKEEAEAFLALMQLRKLRKAWVRDWEHNYEHPVYCISNCKGSLFILPTYNSLSFPTEEMAKEFLECFKDLCETAKRFL